MKEKDQVVAPSVSAISIYDLQLETTCWRDSNWRQNGHVDDGEIENVKISFLAARVFLNYLIEKLKIFFAMICCTVEKILRVIERA